MAEVTEMLLATIRNDLDVTWEDDGMDQKVRTLIARGMAELDDYAGAAQDYETPGKPQSLLAEYCRYAMAGALADFSANYKGDLIGLRLTTLVHAGAGEEAETGAQAD